MRFGHRPRVSAHRRRAARGREDRSAPPDGRVLRRAARREPRPLKPAGQWNQSRVVSNGNDRRALPERHRVLQYELDSPALRAAIAKSKFKDIARFGKLQNGFILLQDHGDRVWYRNIKIRRLPATAGTARRGRLPRACRSSPTRAASASTSPSTASRSRRTSTPTRSRSRCSTRSARPAARSSRAAFLSTRGRASASITRTTSASGSTTAT